MGDVEISIDTFVQKVKRIFDEEETCNCNVFDGVDGVFVVHGAKLKPDDGMTRSVALQHWLVAYEFPKSCFFFHRATKTVAMLAGKNGIDILNQALGNVAEHGITLKTFVRGKPMEDSIKLLAQTITDAKVEKMGVIKAEYDAITGPDDEFGKMVGEQLAGLELVDVDDHMGRLISIKYDYEKNKIRMAATLATSTLGDYLWRSIGDILADEDLQKPRHTDVARDVMVVMFMADEDAKKEGIKAGIKVVRRALRKRSKELGLEMNPGLADSAYNPMIQSDGVYDLKLGAENSTGRMHANTVFISLGTKYDDFCANISRTYVIDPSEEQKAAYTALLSLQQLAFTLLVPGAVLGTVYDTVAAKVEEMRAANPSWLQGDAQLTSTLGCSCGQMIEEAGWYIESKNEKVVQAGMSFHVTVGFEGLRVSQGRQRGFHYVLCVSDTVLVQADGMEVLTEGVQKDIEEVMFQLNDDDDLTPEERERRELRDDVADAATEEVMESRLRSEKVDDINLTEEERRDRDRERMNAQMEEARRRHLSKDEGSADQQHALHGADVPGNVVAYSGPHHFPPEGLESRGNKKLFVDERGESVLLPLNGSYVPFHISCVKNVSRDEQGGYVYLRVNLVSPGQAFEHAAALDPSMTYCREVTYRSADGRNLNAVFRKINELKKKVKQRATDVREKATLVKQEKLIILRGGRPQRLSNIDFRPVISGRKTRGNIEIHENGLRFASIKHEIVEIAFSNIKHAFFQPAEKETKTLIFFYLKDPIMIGKKKQQAIQIFTEVIDASQDLGKMMRKGYDVDEIEEEQMERQKKIRINKEYDVFYKKIQDQSKGRVEFDIPFFELAFAGVPFKQEVTLLPTGECLVHLVDPPFLVLPLDTIEYVHLERVGLNLKNFDMVFVFKDHSKPVQHISAVPTEQKESIKEWLDSNNLLIGEGPMNLNWNKLMNSIQMDEEDFWDSGGWRNLIEEGSDEEGGTEESDPDDEEFKIEGDDDSSSESDSDDEEEEEDESESESESDPDDALEEKGMDWDELEKEAEREDRHTEIHQTKRDRDDVGRGGGGKKRRH